MTADPRLQVHGLPHAPKANAYAERWVRTIRHECLDWTLIWNQRQLHQVLTGYLQHYNRARPHRALDLHPASPTRPITALGPRDGGRTPDRCA